MAGDVDLVNLRQLVGSVVAGLSDMHTHARLAEACTDLGLPVPPDEGSKRIRVNESFAALSDADLPMVAERILTGEQLSVSAATRNAIQDILWADQSTLEIPKRYRRELAQSLYLENLVYSADRFMALLDRFWVLEDDPFSLFVGDTSSLRAGIERHMGLVVRPACTGLANLRLDFRHPLTQVNTVRVTANKLHQEGPHSPLGSGDLVVSGLDLVCA